MQITLYEHKTDKVHTETIAILEFGKFTLSGYDQYLPTPEVPEGGEYEYEILLDMISTQQMIELLAPGKSDTEILEVIKEKFGGERADIRFQAFCFEHDIETYCSSYFDD